MSKRKPFNRTDKKIRRLLEIAYASDDKKVSVVPNDVERQILLFIYCRRHRLRRRKSRR